MSNPQAVVEKAPEEVVQPVSLWGRQLLGSLRPEFLAPVIVPAVGAPIVGNPRCQVAGCLMPGASIRMCDGHRARWARAGRPEVQAWLETASHRMKGHGLLRACAVDNCRRGLAGNSLCSRHLRRWKASGSPDLDPWVAAEVVVPDGRPACRVPGCDLLAESPKHGLCRSHDNRRRQRGFPAMDVFLTDCLTWGWPKFDLGQLPEPMRWEIAYGLQCRVDENRVQTQAKPLSPLLRSLAESGWPSLLERSETEWRSWLPDAFGQNNAAESFLHFTFECLDDFRHGAGWETEYPKDVWLLRRLGYPHARTTTLRFDRISQPWLRLLAKRWTRWRMSTGLSRGKIYQDLSALVRLGECLAEIEPALPGIDGLDRPLLERFIAWTSMQPVGPKSRSERIGAVGLFLRHIRRHEWAPDLPSTAAIYREDLPRPVQLPGRALSEFVMAQLEDEANLARLPEPHLRTLTELLMRTGLRVGDATQLSSDCLVRDSQGAPYLRYVNHKMRREAVVPIDDALATAILAQLGRVRERWPATPCLFPRGSTNPDGLFPMGQVGFRKWLKWWLSTCSVRDETGLPAEVTPHQWRHTYGTRMINAGVPQHVVKDLLDHSSSEMTAHYSRLNQRTIRQHWERATRVDIQGQPAPVDPESPLADAIWVKENLARAKMALPNGFCTLPLQKSCAHANACLTCPLFVTTAEFLPDHRRQLEATRTLITTAEQKGHARLVESNRTVEKNLLRIISALDAPAEGCCDGGADGACSCHDREGAAPSAG